jgi:two-component system cell cycle response regulator
LRAFAGRRASSFRPTDLVCRFGGEEFVVIMPETRAREAELIAERLRQHIQDAAFHLPTGETVQMTVSGGVAVSEGPIDTPDGILKRADEALYRAKTEGRNRILLDGAIAQNENARPGGRASETQMPGLWRG